MNFADPAVVVSALIPTYNRREYVGRAIDSVLKQTLPVKELIVLDDGSTDGTAELIQSRFSNSVRLIRQTNQGVSAARRRLIQEATGDWVAFLDSDDEWTLDRNRLFIEAVKSVPQKVAWIFGDLRLVEDSGDEETLFQKFGLRLQRSPQTFDDPIVLQYPFQFGMLQGSVIRKEALNELHAFSEGFAHSEDFLVGVQVACRHSYAAVDQVVGRLYRTSDLRGSSLDFAGRHGKDYSRARMLAYSLIIQSGWQGPWGERYAHAVRGLCKVSAEQGDRIGRLALEQFRYGWSLKSLAFQCVATFGRPGLVLWANVAQTVRGKLQREI
jgi:glycosyltransferase involved in cell wall biosynthesis